MRRGPVWFLTVFSLFLRSSPLQAELRVHVIDVGYGEATVLHLRRAGEVDRVILIDAGPRESSATLRSWLKEAGIGVIDAVFITHPHPNHYEGVRALPEILRVRKVYWPGSTAPEPEFQKLLAHLKSRAIPAQAVQSSSVPLVFGDLTIQILHPSRLGGSVHEDNLVLLARYKTIRLLWAGDLAPASQALVVPRLEGESVQWATWPHHGDRLDPAWARAMASVRYLVVSVGPNAFGLPKIHEHPSLDRRAWRTDKIGTFSLVTDGQSPLVPMALESPEAR